LHRLFASRVTPAAVWGPKCRQCSLLEICRPRAGMRSAVRYVGRLLDASRGLSEGPQAE
jgi:hypothetical protein